MQKLFNRILSFVMAIIMTLSLTTPVFAADPPEQADSTSQYEPAAQTSEETIPADEPPDGTSDAQNPDLPEAASEPDPVPVAEADLTASEPGLPRLTAIYEGNRIRYYDSVKQPLPEHAELHLAEIDGDEIPFYLQRAAHALGLESCGMYLYFIADPLLEDASTAEVLSFHGNPDDPDDRMTVEITLFDDDGLSDDVKEARLQELRNIHIEDLRVILLGDYWDDDRVVPHSYDEDAGVIRFAVDSIGGFILFIPEWETAVYPEEPAAEYADEYPTDPDASEPEITDNGTELASDSLTDNGTEETPNGFESSVTPSAVPENDQTDGDETPGSNPETPVETPTETPAETPVETPTETPVETPTETPAETPTETPVETPAETPAETPTETPAETPVETPAEAPAETPSETPTETPVETPADIPAETPAAAPTEQTFTASGADYSVSLTYSSDADIPEGSVVALSELPDSGILYDNLTTSVAGTLNADAEDILSVTFVDVDMKKEGASVTPNAYVSVSIEVDDPSDADAVTQVVALGQKNEVLNQDGDTSAFTTVTDSLSNTYAIVRVTKQAKLRTSDDQTWLITVTYDRDDPAIPADVELAVKELKEGDPGYEEYIAASTAVTGADAENLTFAKAFDIKLVDPANGAECQPTREVSVSIQLLEEEVSENAVIDVVHFGDETTAPEQVDCTVNQAESTVDFTTPGFSVYVITGYEVTTFYKDCRGSTWKITAAYDVDSGIPKDAVLQVAELNENSAVFSDYVNKSSEILGKEADNLLFAYAFDITLVNPETGEQYQPDSHVKIAVELQSENLTEMTEKEKVSVVHFKDEAPDEFSAKTEMDSEAAEGQPVVLEASVVDGAVEFETDGFSVFVVTGYTVDFHYGDYDFSIQGGNTISLKELLARLHMVETENPTVLDAILEELDSRSAIEEYDPQDDDEEVEFPEEVPPVPAPVWPQELDAFVANIESVEFTNPDVLTVAKIEEEITVGDLVDSLGLVCQFSEDMTDAEIEAAMNRIFSPTDWAFISTHPFTTEETLTVTMKNGDVYVIDVTDALVRANTVVRNPEVSVRTRDITDVRPSHLNFTVRPNGTATVTAKNPDDDNERYYVPDVVPYNGENYQVTDIHYLTPAHINNRHVVFDDDLVLHMLGAQVEELPEIIDQITAKMLVDAGIVTAEEVSAAGYTENQKLTDAQVQTLVSQSSAEYSTGDNNAAGNIYNLFKQAQYDAENNTVKISMKYLQKMKRNVPLDFIFVYDDSGTMSSHAENIGYNGLEYSASQAVWSRIVLQVVLQGIMDQGSRGYNIRVTPVAFASEVFYKRQFYNNYVDAKSAIGEVYTSGGTDHTKALNACIDLADLSIADGRIPVVVYFSDFHSHANHVNARNAAAALKNKEWTYAGETGKVHVYTVHMFEHDFRYDRNIASDSDSMYITENIDEMLGAFNAIIKDAIGYYIGKNISVQDTLSSGLSSLAETVTVSTQNGSVTKNGYTSTWVMSSDASRLPAGVFYTQTIDIRLKDDQVFSPEMVANAEAKVVKDVEDDNGGITHNTVNKITNQPKPKKEFKMTLGRLDRGGNQTTDTIPGAKFRLTGGDNDPIELTTDENGVLTVYSNSTDPNVTPFRFKLNNSYTLTQLTTDIIAEVGDGTPEMKLPSSSWTLTVDEKGIISSFGGNPVLTVKKGQFHIWNEEYVELMPTLVPVTVKKIWIDGGPKGNVSFVIYGVHGDERVPLPAYDDANRSSANLVTELTESNTTHSADETVWTKQVFVPDRSGSIDFCTSTGNIYTGYSYVIEEGRITDASGGEITGGFYCIGSEEVEIDSKTETITTYETTGGWNPYSGDTTPVQLHLNVGASHYSGEDINYTLSQDSSNAYRVVYQNLQKVYIEFIHVADGSKAAMLIDVDSFSTFSDAGIQLRSIAMPKSWVDSIHINSWIFPIPGNDADDKYASAFTVTKIIFIRSDNSQLTIYDYEHNPQYNEDRLQNVPKNVYDGTYPLVFQKDGNNPYFHKALYATGTSTSILEPEQVTPVYNTQINNSLILTMSNTFTPTRTLDITSKWYDSSDDNDSTKSIRSVTYEVLTKDGDSWVPARGINGEELDHALLTVDMDTEEKTDGEGNYFESKLNLKLPEGEYRVRQASYTLSNNRVVDADASGEFTAFTLTAPDPNPSIDDTNRVNTYVFNNNRKIAAITVITVWTPQQSDITSMPFALIYKSYSNDTVTETSISGECRSDSDPAWTSTFPTIPAYGVDGQATDCSLNASDGFADIYDTEITRVENGSDLTFTIANTERKTTFTVRKDWLDGDGQYIEEEDMLPVSFRLYAVPRPLGKIGPGGSPLNSNYVWPSDREGFPVGDMNTVQPTVTPEKQLFIYNSEYYIVVKSIDWANGNQLSAGPQTFVNNEVVKYNGTILYQSDFSGANNDEPRRVEWGSIFCYPETDEYYIFTHLPYDENVKPPKAAENDKWYKLEYLPGSGPAINLSYSDQAGVDSLISNYQNKGLVQLDGTYTLNSENNWSITFDQLSARYYYFAKEVQIGETSLIDGSESAAQALAQYNPHYQYDQYGGDVKIVNRYPIARVSNDGGTTWEYFGSLISNPEHDYEPGAFDYANMLTGDVKIELLRENNSRYMLTEGFTFTRGKNIIISTTQDESFNPGEDKFTSTVYRYYSGGSLFTVDDGVNLTLENMILDGNRSVMDPAELDKPEAEQNTSNKIVCSDNGGLVCVNRNCTLTVNAGTTLQNSLVSGSGGAIYCSGTLVINDIMITGCGVQGDGKGAAVCLADNASMTMSGGRITGNNNCSNGAVAVGGAGASLAFSGNPVIYGNIVNNKQCNVYLDYDSNAIINTSGLSAAVAASGDNPAVHGAKIGIYVADTASSEGAAAGKLFEDHGGLLDDFGSYTGTDNLNLFINDRNGMYGEADPDHAGFIRWQSYLCKLTMTDNNGEHLLYTDAACESPAVYNRLMDNSTTHEKGGFSETKKALYYVGASGDPVQYPYSADKAIRVEMLKSYEMPGNDVVTVDATREITLKTAQTTVRVDDIFAFNPAEGETDKATIKRASRASSGNSSSLFTVKSGASFVTQNIILDGGATFNSGVYQSGGGAVSVDGGIVNVAANGTLNVSEGTTMCNTAVGNANGSGGKTNSGGAVFVAQNGAVNITGTEANRVLFTSCHAGRGGGAINIGGKENENWYDGTVKIEYCTFTYCAAKSTENGPGGGGAVRCLANHLTVDHCIFDHCSSVAQGGGLYQKANKDKNVASDFEATYCEFTDCSATNTDSGASGGMETQAKTATVDNCHFTRCTSNKNAGALNFYRDDQDITATISNCTFTGCRTKTESATESNDIKGTGFGGALRSFGKNTTTIENCQFNGCNAAWGGAVACFGSVTIDAPHTDGTTLEGSTSITGCTAIKGGGVYLQPYTLTMCGGEISNCSASELGGGIYQASGTQSTPSNLNIINGSILGNSATNNGGGVYLGENSTFSFAGGKIGDVNETRDDRNGGTITIIKSNSAVNGGGIYQAGGSLTINGGSVVNNTATTDGGGIYLGGTNSTLSFNSGTVGGSTAGVGNSAVNGGGIYQTAGTLTIAGGNVKGNTASTNGGGIYLGGTSSIFNFSSGYVGGSTAGEGNSAVDGAGIYQAGGTLTLNSSASIMGNVATGNGGGIYLGGSDSKFNLSGEIGGMGTGEGNSAVNGGGIYQAEGNLTIGTGVSVTGNSATGGNGGGIFLGGGTLTMSGTGAIKKNSASAVTSGSEVVGGNGGGIYLGSGTFKFDDGTVGGSDSGDANTAVNGGGIYVGGTGSKLNLNGGTVKGNTVTSDGAGIYQADGTFIINGGQITGNRADTGNGGGVYLGGGSFTLQKNNDPNAEGVIGITNVTTSNPYGEVTYEQSAAGNSAVDGGGLYVADGVTDVSILGGKISGNRASRLGGGIMPGGEETRLYFSGSIQVFDNFLPQKERSGKMVDVRCDLCLNFDSERIINTTNPGLNEISHIGVYVTGDDSNPASLFNKRGKAGQDFGTFNYDGTDYDTCLNRFINNRSGEKYEAYEYYYGVRMTNDTDKKIYWADYICEITDGGGNLLFTNPRATAPALYQYLGHQGAFDALSQPNQPLYSKAGDQVAADATVYVKMLKNTYELGWNRTVSVPAGRPIILTIEKPSTDEEPTNFCDNPDEYTGHCVISRGNCDTSMFTTAAGSDFTLIKIWVDGEKYNEVTNEFVDVNDAVNHDGGLINAYGNLTLGGNTVLKNARIKNGKSGGAVCFSGDGTYTFRMNNVIDSSKTPVTTGDMAKIMNCKAQYGAALGVVKCTVNFGPSDSIGTEFGGTIENCNSTNGLIYVTGGTLNINYSLKGNKDTTDGGRNFIDCTSSNGGLVYLNNNTANNQTHVGTLNVNGSISNFSGVEKGGVLYVKAGTANLNQSIESCSAPNGGAAYVESGTLNLKHTVSNCEATANGGAVYIGSGTVNIQNATGVNSLISRCKATDGNGGAVYINGNGTLNMMDAALTNDDGIKNCEANAGGAIYTNGTSPKINISAGEISGNTARTASGGAVRMQNGGALTVSGTAVIDRNKTEGKNDRYGGAISLKKGSMTVSGGTFSNNNAGGNGKAYGGAIYVSAGCTLTFSGGTFTGNTAKTDGACVYLANAQGSDGVAILYLSGAPEFGTDVNSSTTATTDDANTVIKNGYASKENGEEKVYTGNKVRQDIFVAETGADPQSIIITGDLTGDIGTIWVWAESSSHYQQLMPFAVLQGVQFAKKDSNNNLPQGKYDIEHLKVFRNAQDDFKTENPLADDEIRWLYGTTEDNQNVCWNGVGGYRKVILRKVEKDTYAPLQKSFMIYKGSSAVAIQTDPFTSGSSGCFYIGTLPYGWYIVEETSTSPHQFFYFVVAESGVYGTLVNESGTDVNKVDGFETRSEAETNASSRYAALRTAGS